MSRFTRRRRQLAIVTPGLVLAFAALLAFSEFLRLDSVRDWVIHTHNVISAAEELATDVAEAEAGQRGYLLTGNDAYLSPYVLALQSLEADTQRLRVLTRDNRSQVVRLDTIAGMIDRRSALLRDAVALRRGGGPDAVTPAILAAGRALTDSIQGEMRGLQQEEETLLAQRQATEVWRRRALLGVFACGMAIVILIGLIVNRALVGYATAQELALRRIEQQNNELQNQAATLQEQAAELEQQRAELQGQRDSLEGQAAELELLNEELNERTRTAVRARAAAETEQQRTRGILDSISDAFLFLDPDWRFAFVNAHAERLLDCSRDELLGRGLWESPPPLLARFGERLRQTVRSGQPVRFEEYDAARGVLLAVALHPSRVGLSVLVHDATAARAAEAEVRVLREAIPQLVWAARPDGTTDYYNERWYEYTGMARDVADRWVWEECVHPDDVEAARAAWQHAVQTGDPYEVEYRLRAADGRFRWFIGRGLAARAPDGTILRWFGTCTDIHEERSATDTVRALSRELKSRVAELETMFSLLPIGVAVSHDPECLDMRVNPTFARMLRVPLGTNISQGRSDAAALPFRALRQGRVLPAEELPMQRAARTGHLILGAEYDLDFGDGDVLHMYGSAAPLLDENGAVQGAVGAFVDVTPRVHAEADRRRLADRTAKLYAFTTALARAFTREQVAALAGEWGRDVLGANASIVAVLSEDGTALMPIYSTGMPADFVDAWSTIPLELPLPMPDAVRAGGVVHLDSAEARQVSYPTIAWPATLQATMAGPLRIEDRTLGAWAVHFAEPREHSPDDVSLFEAVTAQCAQALERSRLFEAERHARQQAEQANQAKVKFLRVMSHDLRTPLNAILGYTELLKNGVPGQVNTTQHTYLSRILASTGVLRTLIDDVLEFARIEAGHVDVHVRDVPAHRLLDDVEALVGPQVRAKGIRLRRLACADVTVRADPERARQILMNLVSNALKFTPEGGEIVVQGLAEGDRFRICVTDTGVGIPPDELEHIFEPFVQAHRPVELGVEQGVGLGLAISRELARAMHGEVSARSEPERGSTFTFELPLAPAAAVAAAG